MPRKIKDISAGKGCYTTLSQTPGNRSKGNYFYKELQDKYDADWEYAPNVVTVKMEENRGSDEYIPMEVRDQRIHNDKGSQYADDTRRLVFRDLWEKRCFIGTKFRFSERFDDPDAPKNIWLTTNMKYLNPGTSATVEKCNGTLGFYLEGEDGLSHPYYEPAIFDDTLSGVSVKGNDTVFTSQATLTAIVQYNERTKDTRYFYTNARFIIGTGSVYKIKNIYKYNAEDTYDPDSPGLLKIFFDVTETSEQDDFEKRIAWNQHEVVSPTDGNKGDNREATIKWTLDEKTLETKQISDSGSTVKAEVVPTDTGDAVELRFDIQNFPDHYRDADGKIIGTYMNHYLIVEKQSDGSYRLTKVRNYSLGKVVIKAVASKSGTTSSIELSMNG